METNIDSLARDFRYALRNLRKTRRFSLIAICALALGIGASTVVFSVVYNVFFHALPYKDFDRSVVFEVRNTANAGGSKGRAYFSPEEFRAFREQNHVFEDMIAHMESLAGSSMMMANPPAFCSAARLYRRTPLTIWACRPCLVARSRRKMAAPVLHPYLS